MKDMTVETLNFIILCMGLLYDLESGLDGLSTTLPRHPRSAITDASHVDSSKKDTVGKESKKHES
ncbi:hypothetical protein [Bifidobacterium adolescentis]|uniref:hypothetical protein n=1 Tax=Bifidobacterium adolescentis TaxID=1680 RepID=UPI0022E8261D|nr:hypothetical protein [Bifidobacterium adolescentis]